MRLEFEAEGSPQRAPRNHDCWIGIGVMLPTTQHRVVVWSFFLHARATYGLLAIEEFILLVSNHVTVTGLLLDIELNR